MKCIYRYRMWILDSFPPLRFKSRGGLLHLGLAVEQKNQALYSTSCPQKVTDGDSEDGVSDSDAEEEDGAKKKQEYEAMKMAILRGKRSS